MAIWLNWIHCLFYPSTLGQLENLTLLWSQPNYWFYITVEFENLQFLERLYLSNNSLIGSIPLTLGPLGNLIHLFLDSNQIESHIPLELGDLSNLEALYLSHNKISGLIRPKLFEMDKLYSLYLSSNQLCGSIALNQSYQMSLCHKSLFEPQLVQWNHNFPNWLCQWL